MTKNTLFFDIGPDEMGTEPLANQSEAIPTNEITATANPHQDPHTTLVDAPLSEHLETQQQQRNNRRWWFQRNQVLLSAKKRLTTTAQRAKKRIKRQYRLKQTNHSLSNTISTIESLDFDQTLTSTAELQNFVDFIDKDTPNDVADIAAELNKNITQAYRERYNLLAKKTNIKLKAELDAESIEALETPWIFHRQRKVMDALNRFLRLNKSDAAEAAFNLDALPDQSLNLALSSKLKNYIQKLNETENRLETLADDFQAYTDQRKVKDEMATFRFAATLEKDTFGSSITEGNIISDKGFTFAAPFPDKVSKYITSLQTDQEASSSGVLIKIIGKPSIPHVIASDKDDDIQHQAHILNNESYQELVYSPNTRFKVVKIDKGLPGQKINKIVVLQEVYDETGDSQDHVKDIFTGHNHTSPASKLRFRSPKKQQNKRVQSSAPETNFTRALTEEPLELPNLVYNYSELTEAQHNELNGRPSNAFYVNYHKKFRVYAGKGEITGSGVYRLLAKEIAPNDDVLVLSGSHGASHGSSALDLSSESYDTHRDESFFTEDVFGSSGPQQLPSDSNNQPTINNQLSIATYKNKVKSMNLVELSRTNPDVTSDDLAIALQTGVYKGKQYSVIIPAFCFSQVRYNAAHHLADPTALPGYAVHIPTLDKVPDLHKIKELAQSKPKYYKKQQKRFLKHRSKYNHLYTKEKAALRLERQTALGVTDYQMNEADEYELDARLRHKMHKDIPEYDFSNESENESTIFKGTFDAYKHLLAADGDYSTDEAFYDKAISRRGWKNPPNSRIAPPANLGVTPDMMDQQTKYETVSIDNPIVQNPEDPTLPSYHRGVPTALKLNLFNLTVARNQATANDNTLGLPELEVFESYLSTHHPTAFQSLIAAQHNETNRMALRTLIKKTLPKLPQAILESTHPLSTLTNNYAALNTDQLDSADNAGRIDRLMAYFVHKHSIQYYTSAMHRAIESSRQASETGQVDFSTYRSIMNQYQIDDEGDINLGYKAAFIRYAFPTKQLEHIEYTTPEGRTKKLLISQDQRQLSHLGNTLVFDSTQNEPFLLKDRFPTLLSLKNANLRKVQKPYATERPLFPFLKSIDRVSRIDGYEDDLPKTKRRLSNIVNARLTKLKDRESLKARTNKSQPQPDLSFSDSLSNELSALKPVLKQLNQLITPTEIRYTPTQDLSASESAAVIRQLQHDPQSQQSMTKTLTSHQDDRMLKQSLTQLRSQTKSAILNLRNLPVQAQESGSKHLSRLDKDYVDDIDNESMVSELMEKSLRHYKVNQQLSRAQTQVNLQTVNNADSSLKDHVSAASAYGVYQATPMLQHMAKHLKQQNPNLIAQTYVKQDQSFLLLNQPSQRLASALILDPTKGDAPIPIDQYLKDLSELNQYYLASD